MNNLVRTWLYFIVLASTLISICAWLGGRQGLLFGFVIAFTLGWITVIYGGRIILWTYTARLIEGTEPYGLRKIINDVAAKADVTPPRIYILPSPTPNCFALGRSPRNASLVVTQGLIEKLEAKELEAIIAHEMAHIKNQDTLAMVTSATLSSFVLYVCQTLQWIFLLGGRLDPKRHIIASIIQGIFAPIISFFVFLALTTNREFMADAMALEWIQDPKDLASALWKMQNYGQALPMHATASTAHLFAVNPLDGRGINRLFNSHPDVEERIRKLTGRQV